jgi:chromate transporter
LREQILSRRKWINEAQFQLAYALSRLTPGTNLLAFTTAIGWMVRRWSGALVALVAASVPCSTIALIATHFFEVWQRNAAFRFALRGALAAAVAVMINTAWVLARPQLRSAKMVARGAVIVPAAILLTTVLPVSPFQVLLLAAGVGLLLPIDEKGDA